MILWDAVVSYVRPRSFRGIHNCVPCLVKNSRYVLSAVELVPELSGVTVSIATLEGVQKERINASPNGYYFLPVYDKGSYKVVVNGPPGWTFGKAVFAFEMLSVVEPSSIDVSIEEADVCGDDLDFTILGFNIYGQV